MRRCPLTDPDARPIIAHRGGALRAPENTLAALTGARALGADAVELDVRMSRDGEVVVIHDPTLDRTTDAHGPVRALTARELERVDAGARFTMDGGRTFPRRGEGIHVPRLAEVIAALPDMPLLIEVKEPDALAPTVRLLESMHATDRSVVASALLAGVAPARGNRLRTGACSSEAARLLTGGGSARLPFDALCTPTRYFGIPLPMGLLVRRARAGGAVTHAWTINDPAEAQRLWRRGVRGMVTDVPDVMARERARFLAGR